MYTCSFVSSLSPIKVTGTDVESLQVAQLANPRNTLVSHQSKIIWAYTLLGPHKIDMQVGKILED